MSTPGMDEVEAILDPPVDVPEDIELEMSDILPRGYLSVSQITMFLKCPHSWYLRYVEGKRGATSARMFQGIQVHKAAESVLTEKLYSGKLPSVEIALDVFSTAFEEQKPLIDDWEDEDPSKVKDLGAECTRIHYREAAVKSTPIMVEKTFHTTISSDGKTKLPVFGRIDSIEVQVHTEDEYQSVRETVAASLTAQKAKKVKLPVLPEVKQRKCVHDIKVVTDKWSENDLANDIQFGIYAGVEHIPDVQVDQIVKGRAKVPRPRYEVLTGIVSNDFVQHSVRVAEGVARSIGMAHFPMTDPGNWWCTPKWCSMWRHCRGKQA